MTIHLHVFHWKEEPHLGIKAGQEIGHLYSDVGDLDELLGAGKILALPRTWLQLHSRLIHYDIWGYRLSIAKERYGVVTGKEMAEDMKGANDGKDILGG